MNAPKSNFLIASIAAALGACAAPETGGPREIDVKGQISVTGSKPLTAEVVLTESATGRQWRLVAVDTALAQQMSGAPVFVRGIETQRAPDAYGLTRLAVTIMRTTR